MGKRFIYLFTAVVEQIAVGFVLTKFFDSNFRGMVGEDYRFEDVEK